MFKMLSKRTWFIVTLIMYLISLGFVLLDDLVLGFCFFNFGGTFLVFKQNLIKK